MTSTGHYLVGISLGIVSAIACGHYYDVGLRWLDIANGLNWIVATLLGQREDEIVLGVPVLLLFFGSLAGARAPDWLEFPMFFGRIRHSAIAHRTLTHTPWVWLVGLVVSVFLIDQSQTYAMYLAGWGCLGFAVSALLHILIDLFSPTGVPVLNPYGKRLSVPLYSTGKPSEFAFLLLVQLLLGGICYILLAF